MLSFFITQIAFDMFILICILVLAGRHWNHSDRITYYEKEIEKNKVEITDLKYKVDRLTEVVKKKNELMDIRDNI